MIQINLPNLRSQGDEATEKKITIWSLKMPPFGAHRWPMVGCLRLLDDQPLADQKL